MGEVIEIPFRGDDCAICLGLNSPRPPGCENCDECNDMELEMMILLITLLNGEPLEDLYEGLCPRHKHIIDRSLNTLNPEDNGA